MSATQVIARLGFSGQSGALSSSVTPHQLSLSFPAARITGFSSSPLSGRAKHFFSWRGSGSAGGGGGAIS
ncbi:hypothetical protein E2C01_071931 [Portunus trituberculatus]|uniref:Uncharacterized protein n=1 Tax=Portunus trituberculatus TaxID=210409 RepID=A0A5B7I7K8_PORTR|nr:hypothetical protein [Portunus trituberculatus]